MSPRKVRDKKYLPLAIFLTLHSTLLSANTNEDELKFQDYRVDSIFTGTNHKLVPVPESDGKWSQYRIDASKQKVNFAGHYIIYTGDCGGGTICGEILDAVTGKIVDGFPNAYELDSSDGSYFDAGYRPESRLLIISGKAADPEKGLSGKTLPQASRTRYFELKDSKLTLIKIQQN